MKNYSSPEIEILLTEGADICTASPGTETPAIELDGGEWNW